MIIFIDENMPPHLARGFDILQAPENVKLRVKIEVKSIKDVFGQGVKDEDWIPIAGKSKACVITQDYNIRRIKHQRKLCEHYNLGMFYFKPPSKSGYKYWDMLKLLVRHWPSISSIAIREDRPFAYKVSARGDLEVL